MLLDYHVLPKKGKTSTKHFHVHSYSGAWVYLLFLGLIGTVLQVELYAIGVYLNGNLRKSILRGFNPLTSKITSKTAVRHPGHK